MLAWWRHWLPSLLDVLIVGGMMAYAFAGFHLVPFHGDESSFIYLSRDYDRLVHQHTLAPIRYVPYPEWALYYRVPEAVPSGPPGAAFGVWGPTFSTTGINPHEQFLRTTTGAINALTIGLAWDIAGYSVNDLNNGWDWSITKATKDMDQWEANVRGGAIPDKGLLDVARIPSALFLAFSVLLVYLITRFIAGLWMRGSIGPRVAGWAAVLIYATTPAVLLNGRRAMQEGSQLFFSVLVLGVALWVLEEQLSPEVCWRRLVIRYISFGVVSGLAIASKQMALLLIGPPFLALCGAPLFRKKRALAVRWNDRHASNMVGIMLASFVVAMLAQPVWWYVPQIFMVLLMTFTCFIGGIPGKSQKVRVARWGGTILVAVLWMSQPTAFGDLIAVPMDMLDQRADLMENQVARSSSLDGLNERLEKIWDETFFANGEYYEDPPWADFALTQQQIARYEDSWLAGRSGGPIWGGALIACSLLGLLALLCCPSRLIALLVVGWWVLPALALLLTNMLPWQRYYLILQPALALIAGIGLGWAAHLITVGAGYAKMHKAVLPEQAV